MLDFQFIGWCLPYRESTLECGYLSWRIYQDRRYTHHGLCHSENSNLTVLPSVKLILDPSWQHQSGTNTLWLPRRSVLHYNFNNKWIMRNNWQYNCLHTSKIMVDHVQRVMTQCGPSFTEWMWAFSFTDFVIIKLYKSLSLNRHEFLHYNRHKKQLLFHVLCDVM